MIQYIVPKKSQFRMNDDFTFELQLDNDILKDDSVKIRIYHLNKLCYEDEKQAASKISFKYIPGETSKTMEGYFVKAFQLRDNKIISEKITACDRTLSWSCAPRYGFLSDFSKKDFDDTDDVTQLNKYHINLVQFYDWMYRHDNFFPQSSEFEDIMGKKSSMDTVKRKIELLHKYGIKAFAYGAVYGAEEEYQKVHKEESLYDGTGKPMKFIDKIYFMDINRNSEWHNHIIREYIKAIDFGFDGIHMDQYGFPKEAYSKRGDRFEVRKLRDDFADLINDTKTALQDGGVIFNAVNNWPVDAVANTKQDCIYIEVWEPNTTYSSLNKLISDAKKYNPSKQVILAAYLHPFNECKNEESIMPTAFLAMATIFASGGFHLLLGENNAMLTQAYYSDYFKIKSKQFIVSMQSYYDFITAYEELLFDTSLIDDTETHTGGINDNFLFSPVCCSVTPQSDCVWTEIKHNDNYIVINLINYKGIKDMNWNAPKSNYPEIVTNISVDAEVAESVDKVLLMSPDTDCGETQSLEFVNVIRNNGNKAIQFKIPELKLWDVVCIKLKKFNGRL